jgi:hypothetical protein
MSSDETVVERQQAGEEFNRQSRRGDGTQVAAGLCGGLIVLRDSLYARIHDDVERRVGLDSMLIPTPTSQAKREKTAKMEIDIYLVAASAAAARDWGIVPDGDPWYLRWLARLRLGRIAEDPKAVERLEYYLSHGRDEARLAFSNVLAQAWAESRRAPLVIFRLVPPAVQVVTALAFGDQDRAAAAREEQAGILPSIRDCHECHGRLLENGEQCPACGNPLWRYDWLVAT